MLNAFRVATYGSSRPNAKRTRTKRLIRTTQVTTIG